MKNDISHFLLAVLAGASFVFSGCKPALNSAVLQSQKPAPAWTLKDLDGREVSFSQFRGKVVVIDFWATWCGPCRNEIPGYIALQKKYGKDGLVIIGVSLDQKGAPQVKKFAEKNAMDYTLLMGDEGIVEAFGSFSAIPTTFLINREGSIVHEKSGAWDHAEYEALIKKVL